jgi:hypothetical protein
LKKIQNNISIKTHRRTVTIKDLNFILNKEKTPTKIILKLLETSSHNESKSIKTINNEFKDI